MSHFCLDDSPFFRMIELDGVDSTNNYLKGFKPLRPVDITLVTAEHQSAGRGQTGNSWESERGQNLLFSILLRPTQVPAQDMFIISEAIALSVRQAIICSITQSNNPQRDIQGATTPYAVTVKWPNDIYVGDRKIAGILIENEISGTSIQHSIVGCGVNINQTQFAFPKTGDSESTPTPVSLQQLTEEPLERRFVLEDIMESFTRYYAQIQSGSYQAIHEAYLKVLYRRTGMHRFRDSIGFFEASIEDVEPSGHLILRDNADQLRRYAFKEVAFCKN